MNLEELINIITDMLKNNIKLKDCKRYLKKYDGKEWVDNSCPKTI